MQEKRNVNIPYHTAKVVEVIITTLQRRGEGKNLDDPLRIITQYWTLDGSLLFEFDPKEEK